MAISSASVSGQIIPGANRVDLTGLQAGINQRRNDTLAAVEDILQNGGEVALAAEAIQGNVQAKRYFRQRGIDPQSLAEPIWEYEYTDPETGDRSIKQTTNPSEVPPDIAAHQAWRSKTGTWSPEQEAWYRTARARIIESGAPAGGEMAIAERERRSGEEERPVRAGERPRRSRPGEQPERTDEMTLSGQGPEIDLTAATEPGPADNLNRTQTISGEGESGRVTMDRGGYAAQQLTDGDPETTEAYRAMEARNETRASRDFQDTDIGRTAEGMARQFIEQAVDQIIKQGVTGRQQLMAEGGLIDQWVTEARQTLGNVPLLGTEKPGQWRDAIQNRIDAELQNRGLTPFGRSSQPQTPTGPQPIQEAGGPTSQLRQLPSSPMGRADERVAKHVVGQQVRTEVDRLAQGMGADVPAEVGPAVDEAAYESARTGTLRTIVTQDSRTGAPMAVVMVAGQPEVVRGPDSTRRARMLDAAFNEPESGEGRHGQRMIAASMRQARPVVRQHVRRFYEEPANLQEFQQEVRTFRTNDPYLNQMSRMIQSDPAAATQFWNSRVDAYLTAQKTMADIQQAQAAARYNQALAGAQERANDPRLVELQERRLAAEVAKLERENRIAEETWGLVGVPLLQAQLTQAMGEAGFSAMRAQFAEQLFLSELHTAEIQRWAQIEGVHIDWARLGLMRDEEGNLVRMPGGNDPSAALEVVDMLLPYLADPAKRDTLADNYPHILAAVSTLVEGQAGGTGVYAVEEKGPIGRLFGPDYRIKRTEGAPAPATTGNAPPEESAEEAAVRNKFGI